MYPETELPFEPLVKVLLSREALLHNLEVYGTKHPGKAIAPVVKSNAYGHGLVPVARVLESFGVPLLVVDAYYEAWTLREAGIRTPILLLGHTATSNTLANRLADTTYTIVSQSQLKELVERCDTPVRIHLKFDTGMNRQGIPYRALPDVATIAHSNENLVITGACTHLADADGPDPALTQLQITRWNALAVELRELFPKITRLHVAASAGSYWANEIDADTLRLGMGLYGFHPQPREDLPLQQVMQVEVPVSVIKWIEPGDTVGYNATFKADEPMPVGVISTGYFSCVNRLLSNRGTIRVNGKDCPIIGRVSMNVTTVDLRPAWPVEEETIAEVISADPGAGNTIARIARRQDTITYTIVTSVAGELPRYVVEHF